ncbi:hypothetical protein ES703_102787 [subsurface metagenome]
MSGKVDLVKLQSILDAIDDNGPRDGQGELMPPFKAWSRGLRRDMEKYRQWTEGVSKEPLPH